VENEPPYTRLLVSLHVLALSAMAASRPHSPQELFELNRFQQGEIERQEMLRRRLGLSTRIPLRLGLAMRHDVESEEQLRRNYSIVRMMDRLSLGLCCTEPPVTRIEDIVARPGAAPVALSLSRTAPTALMVEPWPFDGPRLSFHIACRAVPARPLAGEEELRGIYTSAPAQQIEVTVHAA
jgi:hypothetical protein